MKTPFGLCSCLLAHLQISAREKTPARPVPFDATSPWCFSWHSAPLRVRNFCLFGGCFSTIWICCDSEIISGTSQNSLHCLPLHVTFHIHPDPVKLKPYYLFGFRKRLSSIFLDHSKVLKLQPLNRLSEFSKLMMECRDKTRKMDKKDQ